MELVASARLRRCPAAHRGDAAVRRPDARADGRRVAGRGRGAAAAARAARRRAEGCARAGHRPTAASRARSTRRCSAARSRCSARRRRRARRSSGSAPARRRPRRFVSAGSNVIQSWTGFSERPAYADAQAMAHALAEAFVNGEVDRVVVVYNAFVSPLVQRVTVRELLPIPQELISEAAEAEEDDGRAHPPTSSTSPSRRRSSRGCYPSTSRRSSTGHCSSRPRPSRAPA